jgi:signal transduction histidine kinase
MNDTAAPAGGPPREPEPATWFAPPERASLAAVEQAAAAVTASPLVATLLKTYGSLIAVLNEQRQVVAVNDGLLRFLGITQAGLVLGLRPGEAFKCTHAQDHPGGCGTSRFCATCGAAIAIVLSLESSDTVERECLLTVRNPQELALELNVRAVPLELEGRRLVLLLLQDIRGEKRLQTLERVFFHDINNTLTALLGAVELLRLSPPAEHAQYLADVERQTYRLRDEIASQRILCEAAASEYRPNLMPISVTDVMERLRTSFAGHRLTSGRRLTVTPPLPDAAITTDPALLTRVLVNMTTNALEATPDGGEARVWCESDGAAVTWKAWNAGVIPEDVGRRIFQRYFTTKTERGRGLGTYSMRLLGECYLKGKVGFDTSPQTGTLFWLRLPR